MSLAAEQHNSWAVEADGLSKRFGHLSALRNISFKVPCQSFAIIAGPNGAGKTTLLRILATLSRPSSGWACVNGLDLQEAGPAIRRHIGFVSHQTLLYGDLSAVENLRFYGRMYQVPELERRIAEVLVQFDLTERHADPVRTLSRGLQQRLSLARAILHRPSVLLLDEPYAGLDARGADNLDALLRRLQTEGHTILMATHDLARGAEMAQQLLILVAGKIVYEASSAALSAQELQSIYRQYAASVPFRGEEVVR